MNLLFQEQQRFTQWWLWVLLIGINLLFLVGVYQQIIRGIPFGDNPAPNAVLIGLLFFVLGLSWWFWRMVLYTEISAQEIKVKLRPLVQRRIPWTEVSTAKIVNYGFVGGWGVRVSKKYGIVYNMRGKEGLALTLNDGTKLCIGTQKAAELSRVLREQLRQLD